MIHVVAVDGLPRRVRGCIGMHDGGGMILLNASCSIEERAEALRHEIAHVMRGDFRDSTKTADEIECISSCEK